MTTGMASNNHPTAEEIEATTLALREINARSRSAWELESRMAGGLLGGAWLIGDGASRAVLKWQDRGSSVPRNPDAGEVVAYIRDRGYPTPAWLDWGVTNTGATYSIQEFIQGQQLAHRLDKASVGIIVDLVDRQRALSPPTEFNWSSFMRDLALGSHPSHERLSSIGAFVAETLAQALALAAPHASEPLPDREMVHSDLGWSNILVHEGQLSGVVDIDACGRGCAAYDVLHLSLDSFLWDPDPQPALYLQRYASENYKPGPVAIAAATLVIEMLTWRADRYPERLPAGSRKAQEWMSAIRNA